VDYGAIVLISVLAAAAQAVLGFGYSLLFAPVAALLVAPSDAIGASIITGTVGSVFYYLEYRPRTPVREVAPMALAAIVAAPLGLWLLVAADEVTLRLLIGLTVLASAVFTLTLQGEPHPRRAGRLPVELGVGLVSGVMRGAVSLPGPAVILYHHWAGGGAEGIRSRMFSYFVWTGVPTVLLGLGGQVFAPSTWGFAAAAIGGLAPGIALGRLGRPRLSERLFSRLSMALLAATSAMAIFRALASLSG